MLVASLLEVDIMADFGMEKSEDGKTPKMEIPTNLDAKTYVIGHGSIIGKSVIQEFFNCTRTLVCDDIPILKGTKYYVEAIFALVLKLERRFICTHPTLQRLFCELHIKKNRKLKRTWP